MAEAIMPATEAAVATHDDERNSYELAFHVLPTVAEGEVSGVFELIKDIVTKEGGEIFGEEAPERVDLAYDIVEHVEGKNRAFHSAYFGWVRFRMASDTASKVLEAMKLQSEVLRHLLIKLTREEEQKPFYFHEAQKENKKVEVVEEKEVLTNSDGEGNTQVSEEKLDESLEKITEDTDVSKEKVDDGSIEEKKDEN